jgi:hypothetical protein
MSDLSILIKTILQASSDDIKKQLAEIQNAVSSSHAPIKIPVEFNKRFDDGDIKRTVKKIGDTLSGISHKSFSDAFGIQDKQTLKELTDMVRDYRKARDGIDEEHISGSVFDKVRTAIQQLSIEIQDTDQSYRDFIAHVNKSKIHMEPFGYDYEEMRRAFGVGIVSSKGGMPIDSWYGEARDMFPLILPDVSSAEDQFESLLSALKTARKQLKSQAITGKDLIDFYGGEDEIRLAVEKLLKSITAEMAEIGNHAQEATQGIHKLAEATGSLSSLTEIWHGEQDGDPAAVIKEINDGLGRTITLTETLDKETQEYDVSLTRITENYKKQRQILDTLAANKSKTLNTVDLELSKAFDNTAKPLKLEENISQVRQEAETA